MNPPDYEPQFPHPFPSVIPDVTPEDYDEEDEDQTCLDIQYNHQVTVSALKSEALRKHRRIKLI